MMNAPLLAVFTFAIFITPPAYSAETGCYPGLPCLDSPPESKSGNPSAEVKKKIISFLEEFHIACRGEPETLLAFYPPHAHQSVLKLRSEVNRIWPIRSYQLLHNSVRIMKIPDKKHQFLVNYQVRTLTRNEKESRDRMWWNEAVISFAGEKPTIEEEKVLKWKDL